MRNLFLTLIVIMTILSGCDKRENTFNKIYGNYTLEEYTVDGTDSLYFYKDSLGTDIYFYYDDLHGEPKCRISGARNDGKDIPLWWNWGLNENKYVEIIYAFGPIGIGPFGQDKKPIWEILYLTRSKIKMKTIYANKEYFIYLK